VLTAWFVLLGASTDRAALTRGGNRDIADGGYLLADQFVRDIHTFPKICCTYSFGSAAECAEFVHPAWPCADSLIEKSPQGDASPGQLLTDHIE